MDPATYETVAAVVEAHARSYGSRWPSISADDFRQEGWALALEALPRHDESRGELAPFLSHALKRDLLCFAYRTVQPVKTRRSREYKHADISRANLNTVKDVIDPYPQPVDALAEVEVACIVREAVKVVTACEPVLAEYLLDGKTQRKLADEYGGTVHSWSWKCRKVREAIRAELRGRL